LTERGFARERLRQGPPAAQPVGHVADRKAFRAIGGKPQISSRANPDAQLPADGSPAEFDALSPGGIEYFIVGHSLERRADVCDAMKLGGEWRVGV